MVTPKPVAFDAALAPPGVQVKFISFWQQRGPITPRLLLVHTNAATGEGTIDSAYNWANQQGSNHTIPHYQVDRQDNGSGFIARKLLPTNRKGIANQTAPSVDGYETYGSVQTFSLAIETADLGYPTPGQTVGFTPAQAEMIARIIAYESIVWQFPIALPTSWHGTGVASHTDPYGYPEWTIVAGKICPGDAKKAQVKSLIIPRANAIKTEWTAPKPPPLPPPSPLPDLPEGAELKILSYKGYAYQDFGLGYKVWVPDRASLLMLQDLRVLSGKPKAPVVNLNGQPAAVLMATGPILGPKPDAVDEYGL